MVGRTNDYICDATHDARSCVSETDVIWCGTTIIKRACDIFGVRQYEAEIMPVGMRSAYHAPELALK